MVPEQLSSSHNDSLSRDIKIRKINSKYIQPVVSSTEEHQSTPYPENKRESKVQEEHKVSALDFEDSAQDSRKNLPLSARQESDHPLTEDQSLAVIHEENLTTHQEGSSQTDS